MTYMHVQYCNTVIPPKLPDIRQESCPWMLHIPSQLMMLLLSPPIVQCPEQERFIAYKTRTVKKEDKKTTDLTVGWYSKDDMSKMLKWNSNHGCNSLQRLHRCLAIAVSSTRSIYILKTLSFRVPDHVGSLGFLGRRLPEPSRSVSRIPRTWSGFQNFLIS